MCYKDLHCLEETIGRNVDVQVDSVEDSDGNVEYVIGHWEGHLCREKNLADLGSRVLWKVELVHNTLGCLAWRFLDRGLKVWPGCPDCL